MLPKVATTLLHTTTRAAAAVQNQTLAIRNVWQLQSTSSAGPSGGSGSNWGNNGPGPGGPKYNAGSRFHSGYAGASRAVTQANLITSQDVATQLDDSDEVIVRRLPIKAPNRPRMRSHSLSMSGQDRRDRGETMGVLKSVQQHARSRHAFAQPSSSDTPSSLSSVGEKSQPALVRRNSTSIPSPSLESLEGVFPGGQIEDVQPEVARSRPTSRPSTPSARSRSASPFRVPSPVPSEHHLSLLAARESKDASVVASAVHKFLQDADTGATTPSALEFNAALEAIHETRKSVEPLNFLLDTYNAMLKHSILPDPKTYSILIYALTARDNEVQRSIHASRIRIKRREAFKAYMSGSDAQDPASIDVMTRTIAADEASIAKLEQENNFGSAMSLFEAALSLSGNRGVPLSTYLALLRSAAHHSNVPSAIHVFAQLERRNEFKPSDVAYKYLMLAYMRADPKDVTRPEEVFKEYLEATRNRSSQVEDENSSEALLTDGLDSQEVSIQRTRQQLCNQMIEVYFHAGQPEKGVGFLEQMIRAASSEGTSDLPPPSSSTFTTVLTGFCQSGDVATALIWFDRLLEQGHEWNGEPWASHHNVSAIKPDHVAFTTVMEALAANAMVDDLNRVFCNLLQEISQNRHYKMRYSDRSLVHITNMKRVPELDDAQAHEILLFLRDTVLADPPATAAPGNPVVLHHFEWLGNLPLDQKAAMHREIWQEYMRRGMFAESLVVLSEFVGMQTRRLVEHQLSHSALTAVANSVVQQYSIYSTKLFDAAQATGSALPFGVVSDLIKLGREIHLPTSLDTQASLVQSFFVGNSGGSLVVADLAPKDRELVIQAALDLEEALAQGVTLPVVPGFTFGDLTAVLEELSQAQLSFSTLNVDLVRRIVAALVSQHGLLEARLVIDRLGAPFSVLLGEHGYAALQQESNETQSETASVGSDTPPTSVSEVYLGDSQELVVDPRLTRSMDEILMKKLQSRSAGSPRDLVLEALRLFERGVAAGQSPAPLSIGRLIQALGRANQVSEVRTVYTAAQRVLQSLENNKKWQAESWYMIEDSMIIALAHAGDVDMAHVHRQRILEQGGAPTADAYGALILYVKDTTDDTSNAMTLFQESQMHGIAPNQYLYNNIISKLAKARKADYALELFQQMKANRIYPSSITYGAVIGACARVGDVQSAEILFAEMIKAPKFKARVPPFNTMMQLYTTTKPNRERALYFFDQLKAAGVSPTAHTYKLLMDAYGAIEPIDIPAMEGVFHALLADKSVVIQGTHFASLINAYGCVQKDLEKAIATFDAIPSYYPRAQAPDAVVFEAMINVLAALHRTDLMPEYINKMNALGVHMTAYIANFLIKGYANVGDLEHARGIFESLADPAEGVAAPNNHAPHDPETSRTVDYMAPVYREPSTWETMIRAELGAGNRAGALELLERLRARQYPESVYNRISGILVDHSTLS